MSLRAWAVAALDPASPAALSASALVIGLGSMLMNGVSWILGRRELISSWLGLAIAVIGFVLALRVFCARFISSRRARSSSDMKAV